MRFLAYMIRKALPSDLQFIFNLTQACAKAMIVKGIYQWNEYYPTKERFEMDIGLQELYVLEKESIIGIIVLTEIIDKEYIPIQWLTQNLNNLYIHRLAVHPTYWGQGYAQKLMEFAEEHAKKYQYESIRLDTFSQNQRNQKFYETPRISKARNYIFSKTKC